ncbi:MAG: ArsR/SmtB family transcription factor [Sedimentitalea sp.]
MHWETAATGFAAMGSEARLQVLRVLVRAGQAGLTVGDIQKRTGLAPSTLAHHLRFLAAGGVVEQTRDGRSVINRADFRALTALAHFILSECCADEDETSCSAGKEADHG